ncbi:MAG: hybrid sensor histidine kinase/response regulator [Chloroflexota bacterium]|nr:MAG: hybrid sensor histidine kinase/response regulator [Chloroflexota bacterium]
MPSDPYRYFRIEARELLDQLGRGVMDLEKAPAPDVVAKLLRLAHTLKGAARVVKQREIADQSHAIEGALAPHRDSSAPVPPEIIDAVLRHVDAIGTGVSALASPDAPGGASPHSATEEIFRTAWADVADVDDLINGLAEAHSQVASLRRSLPATERARHLVDLLAEVLAPARALAPVMVGRGAANGNIHAMVEELGELFGSIERALALGVDQVDREMGQVRESAERLRLVPAGVLFTMLERTVRDAAQMLAKNVDFEGRGGSVRLEAHVLATIRSALLQVVGNAVAHGIESEAERRTAGKAPRGRIVLEVARRGRRVIFSCRDDGRGVDLEAVRRVAQRRGFPQAEAQRLGAEELLRLLLKGGISTSAALTEVSGRGIGLDIAREAVERLGGEVNVRTEAGTGTTIDLVVPLSIASFEGLLVEAEGFVATIPLDAVRRTVRLGPNDVAQSPLGVSMVHEGRTLPFLPLARALTGRASRSRETRACTAVIVEGRAGLAAIGVERLLGTVNVVLRALPGLAPATAIVAGASLDTVGNPQLVLDPDGLVAEAQRAGRAMFEPEVSRTPVLVIDDSLTTRMLEQSILESAGYDVDAATSGEEALEKARAKRYSLFLVDIEMPGMDGFTFIERTRADSSLRDVPSILVSSRASPEDRRRGEQVGAVAYIVKSEFDQAALLDRIRRLVA